MTSDEFKDRRPAQGSASLSDPDGVQLPAVNAPSTILTEEVFSLLAERLTVNLNRRKIGEIVVRKEIETQIVQVQVPVRREKLIVEQVSPEYQLLAEIDLDQTNTAHLALLHESGDLPAAAVTDDPISANHDREPTSISPGAGSTNEVNGASHRTQHYQDRSTVYGEIYSPQAASDLLTELANLPTQDWEIVRIEIVLKDAKHQDIYQALVDRYDRV